MSFRLSLPTKLIPITRIKKDGKIEDFINTIHYNPNKHIDITKPKRKYKVSELAKYYRSLGGEGVLKFVSDVIGVVSKNPGLLKTLTLLFNAQKEVKKLQNANNIINQLLETNKIIANSKDYFDAKLGGKVIDKKLKQKKKKLLQLYNLLKDIEPKLKKYTLKSNIEKAIKERIGNKVSNIQKFADVIIDTYKYLTKLSNQGIIPSNFLENEQTFLNAIKQILYNDNSKIKSIINNLLSNKHTKRTLEEMLITSPFNIDSEEELIMKMLENTDIFEHTLNSYIKELFISSDNKNTKEIGKLLNSLQEINNGKPKIDHVIFYKLFRSIVEGAKKYNLSISESIVLFFYINGNTKEGKLLPINYLHHNDTMRTISELLLEKKRELKDLTPDQHFTLQTNDILFRAIKKLPKVHDIVLFRGENVTPITFNAKKGDLIVYETPLSTSSTPEQNINIRFTSVENGKIKEYKKTIKQGAKVFVRGNGTYARINSGVLSGSKPEYYEGHREFLKSVKKELGTIPQGVVISIKSDIAYKVPPEFTTISNRFQNEHLLPPGIALSVEKWEEGERYGDRVVKHRGSQNGGIYTLTTSTINTDILENEHSFTSILAGLYSLTTHMIDENGRILPKKKI